MTQQLRVNLKTAVNNATIRREQRNGKEVIIVPSATLPDDVVMNDILYPADVIAAGYHTLEGTYAPLGHPYVNGVYVNAASPEAINGFHVGAWNENVRRENGRVFLDKVIDVEFAERTERGRRLIEAINTGKPIHTSTGLFLEVENAADGAGYKLVALSMEADHDAILLGEEGAATPEQGVGIFVNSKGEQVECTVVNSELELTEEALESIAESIAWQLEHEARQERQKPIIEKIMSALRGIISKTEGDALSVNSKEGQEMSDEKLKEVTDAIAALNERMDGITDQLKANSDAVNELKTNAEQSEAAERDSLIERVVKANALDEETAKEASTVVLRKLAANIQGGKPAEGVAGGYVATNASDLPEFTYDIEGEK